MSLRLQPASPEELLKAFQTLDKERTGVLSRNAMVHAMMEEGEPFTQEEIDEMMAVAISPETGDIPYEYYINQIMVCFFKFNLLLLGLINLKNQRG